MEHMTFLSLSVCLTGLLFPGRTGSLKRESLGITGGGGFTAYVVQSTEGTHKEVPDWQSRLWVNLG